MFEWAYRIVHVETIDQLRFYSQSVKAIIPSWVLYSLPDALWLYSLTAFTILVWSDTRTNWKVLWISLGLLLAIALEFGQLFQIYPGTFDLVDLFLYCLAFILAIKLAV